MDKLNFKGLIISIQPRIRLTRSFDEAKVISLLRRGRISIVYPPGSQPPTNPAKSYALNPPE
jgi:hypothetical protein